MYLHNQRLSAELRTMSTARWTSRSEGKRRLARMEASQSEIKKTSTVCRETIQKQLSVASAISSNGTWWKETCETPGLATRRSAPVGPTPPAAARLHRLSPVPGRGEKSPSDSYYNQEPQEIGDARGFNRKTSACKLTNVEFQSFRCFHLKGSTGGRQGTEGLFWCSDIARKAKATASVAWAAPPLESTISNFLFQQLINKLWWYPQQQ